MHVLKSSSKGAWEGADVAHLSVGKTEAEGTTPRGPKVCLAALHGGGGERRRSILHQRDKQVILIQCIPSSSLTVLPGTIV